MTVICAYYDNEHAYIGADSGAFDSDSVVISTTQKVWRVDETLIGVAGSFRVVELARQSNIADPYELRDFLLADYNTRASHPTAHEATILTVNTSGIHYVSDDFSVIKVREHYGATGASGLIALGALSALSRTDTDPRSMIDVALKVAAQHTLYARAPFKILQT